MQSTENVFIIGGGIGGLNCARLLQKDYHVELIEAVSRLGGRVKTRVIDGIGCDCGAQFFSAEDSSVIRLVSELGLSDEKRPFDLSRFSVRKDAKSIPTKLNEIEGLVKFAGFIGHHESAERDRLNFFSDLEPDLFVTMNGQSLVSCDCPKRKIYTLTKTGWQRFPRIYDFSS